MSQRYCEDADEHKEQSQVFTGCQGPGFHGGPSTGAGAGGGRRSIWTTNAADCGTRLMTAVTLEHL